MSPLAVAVALAIPFSLAFAIAALARGGLGGRVAAGIALAAAVGWWPMAAAITGWNHWRPPSFPPVSLGDWMPGWCLVAAAAGFAAARLARELAGLAVMAAVAVVLAVLAARLPELRARSVPRLALEIGPIALAWLAMAWSWEEAAIRGGARLAWTSQAAVGGAIAVCLLLFGSFTAAMHALVVVAALGGIAAWSWWRPPAEAGGVSLAAALLFGGRLLFGRYVDADLPLAAALLLAAAGAAPALAAIPAIARRGASARIASTALAALALVAGPLTWGVVSWLRSA